MSLNYTILYHDTKRTSYTDKLVKSILAYTQSPFTIEKFYQRIFELKCDHIVFTDEKDTPAGYVLVRNIDSRNSQCELHLHAFQPKYRMPMMMFIYKYKFTQTVFYKLYKNINTFHLFPSKKLVSNVKSNFLIRLFKSCKDMELTKHQLPESIVSKRPDIGAYFILSRGIRDA
ncbi:hypothetical protein [Francisella sp. LA112445]|uniref:hypothetical protein n=1 Tax=Francisella sp. LA112445 TaxID=1395624 RepID=UPI001788E395|nr:hypothetical protein [Francisella sp. LA112445]QIW10698.1 hypothetical protein FIP56_08275 [Francisella sp. LA112445]